MGARQVFAEHGDKTALAQPIVAQHLLKTQAVELLELILKGRCRADFPAHQIVADGDAEPVGAEAEQRALDDAVEHHLDQAHGARLLAVEAAAEGGLQAAQFALVIPAQVVGRDLPVPDPCHRCIDGAALEHVRDAPRAKAQDQQPEQELDQDRAGTLADGTKHGSPE